MRTLRILWSRVRGLIGRAKSEQDLEDELQFHFAQQVDLHISQGMTRTAAEREARRRFGGIDKTKELYRDTRGLPFVESLFQDLKYGFRMLRKSPAFTAVAIVTLALGMGANTAVFTLFNAILLRPMPVEEPERLVILESILRNGSVSTLVDEEVLDILLRGSSAFEGALYTSPGVPARTIRWEGGSEESISITEVNGEFATVLGIEAQVGRLLTGEDDRAGAEPVAMISDRYWYARFLRDPAVIGQSFYLEDTSITVVGVLPEGFSGVSRGDNPDIYLPFNMAGATGLMPNMRTRYGIGRLRDGVSLEQADVELDSLIRPLIEEEDAERAGRVLTEADDYGRAAMRAVPGARGFPGSGASYETPLGILFPLVGLVLLLAATNLSSMLVSRAAGRQREISIRAAVGAGRWRLVRQFLAETFVLTVLGGLAGVMLSLGMLRALGSMLARSEVQAGALPAFPDQRALGFTAAVLLVTTLLIGLAPAWRAALHRVDEVLKATRFRRSVWLGHGLVVVQVALSMMLVVGALLFGATLLNMFSYDAGFDRHGVLTVRLEGLPGVEVPIGILDEILNELKELSEVDSASIAQQIPFDGGVGIAPAMIDEEFAPLEQGFLSSLNTIGPDFFATMRIGLLEGRLFNSADRDGDPVVVVSESLARRAFGERSAVGTRVWDATVIGVVADSTQVRLRDDPITAAQYRLMDRDWPRRNPYLVIRAANGVPESVKPVVETVVSRVAPSLQIGAMVSLDEYLHRMLYQERMMATLSGFFGAIALLIAAIGIFGVMAFHVTQRTGEFGIRMALGATPTMIVRKLLGGVGAVLLVGIAVGVAGALALTGIAESMLFGLTPRDPLAFAVAGLVLAAVGVLAGYLPARRVSRLDPMVALRHE